MEALIACVDAQRDTYGVESICAQVPIAPSTYWRHKAQQADPSRRSGRAHRDDVLRGHIQRVYDANEQVYGAEKVWRQLRREDIVAARCTVERLMRAMGLRGVVRGAPSIVTTRPDVAAAVPDLVARAFTATRPNQLWVSDFTYVATADGFVYTAFVFDVFARRIIGWKVAHARRTDLVLDALEQAFHQRQQADATGLVHRRPIPIDAVHRASRRCRHCPVGRESRRFVRQCDGRIDHRPLQDGADWAARSVADSRGRGIRHAALGGLVQLSAAARADRLRAARRVRSAVLSTGRGGLSHIIRPLGFPGRFIISLTENSPFKATPREVP